MSHGRCTFSTSDGRQCTSLLYPGHSFLCHQHLRKELDGVPPSDDVASDILGSIQNFQSATAVNAALGKIFVLLAAGRIKRQDAIGLAYICQLMLQSLKGFKDEIRLTRYEQFFERDLIKVLNGRTPLEEFILPPQSEPASEEALESNAETALHCGSEQSPENDSQEIREPASEKACQKSYKDSEKRSPKTFETPSEQLLESPAGELPQNPSQQSSPPAPSPSDSRPAFSGNQEQTREAAAEVETGRGDSPTETRDHARPAEVKVGKIPANYNYWTDLQRAHSEKIRA